MVKIKVKADNLYVDLARSIKHGNLQLHCNDYYDLLIFNSPVNSEIIETLRIRFNGLDHISVNTADPPHVNYVMIPCSCSSSSQVVLTHIMKNHGIQTAAVKYSGEWEIYEFFCINKSDVSDILSILAKDFEYQLISSIEHGSYFNPLKILSLSANELFLNFTPNQIELLKEVYREGYYTIPRKTKLADIAEKHNKSRWAVEKTLRKIENKVMDMIVPLIDFEKINQSLIISE